MSPPAQQTRVRAPGSGRAGTALIEAVVVLPILILLLLGIMEVSRVLMTYNLLTRSVRAGARLAVVIPDLTENNRAVLDRIGSLVKDGGATVADSGVAFLGSTPKDGDSRRGEMVRVRARVDFVPVTSMVFGNNAAIPLRAQVIARHE